MDTEMSGQFKTMHHTLPAAPACRALRLRNDAGARVSIGNFKT
jgi:hypothetical protein